MPEQLETHLGDLTDVVFVVDDQNASSRHGFSAQRYAKFSRFAVLRRGSDAWLVAARGRVLAALEPGSLPPLPRIWLAAQTGVTVGLPVATGDAVRVAAALRDGRFPGHVLSVRDGGGGQLVLQLASGREVRLGDVSNLAVKLAVAAAILPRADGALYIDVSVPTRAVAGYATGASAWPGGSSATGTNPQVSGQG